MKNLIKFAVLPALLFVSTLTFANTSVAKLDRTTAAPATEIVAASNAAEVEVPVSAVVIVSSSVTALPQVTCEVCINILIMSGCVSWCCANCPAEAVAN